jgi:hypothetical protein
MSGFGRGRIGGRSPGGRGGRDGGGRGGFGRYVRVCSQCVYVCDFENSASNLTKRTLILLGTFDILQRWT